jgi:hypothetical protein
MGEEGRNSHIRGHSVAAISQAGTAVSFVVENFIMKVHILCLILQRR